VISNNQHQKGRVRMRRFHLSFVSLTLIGAVGLAACGSDDDGGSADDTEVAVEASNEAADPEDVIVSDSIVTAGLQKLPSTIDAAIAAIGTAEAKEKLDAIEAEWFSFEGTVRQNDTELYLAIEDQLTPLQRQIEDGDATTASATADTLNALFDQYLAKYP
jgi:hypothetical protein